MNFRKYLGNILVTPHLMIKTFMNPRATMLKKHVTPKYTLAKYIMVHSHWITVIDWSLMMAMNRWMMLSPFLCLYYMISFIHFMPKMKRQNNQVTTHLSISIAITESSDHMPRSSLILTKSWWTSSLRRTILERCLSKLLLVPAVQRLAGDENRCRFELGRPRPRLELGLPTLPWGCDDIANLYDCYNIGCCRWIWQKIRF